MRKLVYIAFLIASSLAAQYRPPSFNTPNSVSAVGVVVTASPYYASGYVAQTQLYSSCASGSSSCQVNSVTGFNVGQVVIIGIAGASATNFAGIISSISGSSAPYTIAFTAASGASIPAQSSSGSTTGATSAVGNTVWTFGSTTLTAGVSAGATSIPVANAASYSQGQGILLTGEGTSGTNSGDYVGTIASVSGNTIFLSTPTGTTVSSGANVQHDDTTAFQSAINNASALASVHVIVPDGFYQINGPLQNTVGANSILMMPTILYLPSFPTVAQWTPMTTVEISGLSPAPMNQGWSSTSSPGIPHLSGAILFTNRTSGNFIGGYDSVSYEDMTNVNFVPTNLTLRTVANNGITMIQAEQIAVFNGSGLNLDTSSTATTPAGTVLTNTSSTAIVFPGGGNAGNNSLENAEVSGYYNGIKTCEHDTLQNIRLDSDYNGLRPQGCSFGWYGTSGNNVAFNGVTYAIYADGAGALNLSGVNEGGSMTAGLYDPNNYLYGTITMDIPLTSFSKVGGAKVSLTGTGYALVSATSGSTPGLLAKIGSNFTLQNSLTSDAPVSMNTGTSFDLYGPSNNYACTGACTVYVGTPPASPGGNKFEILADDDVAAAITVVPPSTVQLETTARTSYCTAGQSLVSGGAVGDFISLLSRDATHYLVDRANGTWTCTASGNLDPWAIFSTSIQNWYRGDNLSCSTNGCSIASINDKVNNANTTVLSGTAPTLTASGLNSQPVINVGTANLAMSLGGSPYTPTAFSAFMVLQVPNLTNTYCVFGGLQYTGGSPEVRINSSTGDVELLAQSTAAIATSTTGLTAGSYHMVGVTYNSTTGAYAIYVDSTTANVSGTNVKSFSSPLSQLFQEGGSNKFLGQLAELVIVNSVATSTQVSQMMGSGGYFLTRYPSLP
jgi:hypothetical protein